MNWKQKLPDAFVIGLIAMVILASLFPFTDEYAEVVPLKTIIYWGITGIFFLYGLKLNPKKIREDIGNWRLHLLIQSTTFLIFPLIVLALYPLFSDTQYYMLWLATFFLAVLPSTVSSSVVMVSIAKGNVPASIFNASISGLIGLFATPLWMSLFMKHSDEGQVIGEMVQQLILQILLPVFIGLLLNRYLGRIVQKRKTAVSWFDKIIIFLIIYKSFSAAFITGVFTQVPAWTFLTLSVLIVLFFFLIFGIVKAISKWKGFNREDTITALFCASKKSLVHGSVFVTLIITETSLQSLFLLPIMIYHAFQLFYTSNRARVWGRF